MSDYIITIVKDINFSLLLEEIKALGLPEHGISMSILSDGTKIVTVHFDVEPTIEQKNAAATIIYNHDATVFSTQQTILENARTKVIASTIKDYNPEQVITWLENQIDGWATLADAKVSLKNILPVMAALILEPSLLREE